MTRRKTSRVQPCGADEARSRLEHARRFLEVAELAATDHKADGSLEYGNAAATLAVLAGIAATDAACCKALGQRSRAEDRHDAEQLIELVTPGGSQAAGDLRRLIALKNDAQYGFYNVGRQQLTSALRQARKLVDFAATVLQR